MRIYSRKNLHWENNQLLLKDEKLSGILEVSGLKDMWKVEYPDGKPSADFYNKSRAKEYAYEIALGYINKTKQETPLAASLVRLNEQGVVGYQNGV